MIKLKEANITFLGEQDGAPERRLKSVLGYVFAAEPLVQRAYLVRARSGAGPTNVLLALSVSDASTAERVVTGIRNAFAAQFASSQFLDIMFLSPTQESELRQMCRSFYEVSPSEPRL